MFRTTKEKEFLIKAIDAPERTFIIISPEYTILAANKFTSERYGTKIIGMKCHELFHNRSTACENCSASEAVVTCKPVLRNKSDEYKHQDWMACRYSYPIFSDGKLDSLAVLEFERPSSEEMGEKLRRSNAFLRNLILSSVDGVIASDMKGNILIFNDAAAEISGYTVEEALATLSIRKFYPGDGARYIMRKLRSDENGGKGKLISYKTDALRKNGETIPILLNAAIVYEDDQEVATIGFFHDMREEIRMKAELEKTQVQLLQAEKMSSLGKLSAGVAHQLNNPLGGITLFAKLILEEYDLDEAIRNDVNRILQDAQRCRDTVKELLEFARQTSHLVRPHDINNAISRTLFLLENQTLFQNIRIRKSFADNLPDVLVDIQQMNHVFMNIILNAAQAMDGQGMLTVETGLSEKKDFVCIGISDTGPGIPKKILQHIFDPFFTTKEEGKGTGLGLSMVYGIVEKHGGKISANSVIGEGTTFLIELPIDHSQNKGGLSDENA